MPRALRRGCDLAFFKNPGNICDHIHNIKYCVSNVYIFPVGIFSVVFLHKEEAVKKTMERNKK